MRSSMAITVDLPLPVDGVEQSGFGLLVAAVFTDSLGTAVARGGTITGASG